MDPLLLVALALCLALVVAVRVFLSFLKRTLFGDADLTLVPTTPLGCRIANLGSIAKIVGFSAVALAVPVRLLPDQLVLPVTGWFVLTLTPMWWRGLWHGVAAWRAIPVQHVQIGSGVARLAVLFFLTTFALVAALALRAAQTLWALDVGPIAALVATCGVVWLALDGWLALRAHQDGPVVAVRRIVGPSIRR
jgi:hypothetical protein